MKKEKLIEMLSKLPPNADVYLWNGLVNDFVDIKNKIEEDILTKESVESFEKHYLYQKRFDSKLEFSDPDCQKIVLSDEEKEKCKKAARYTKWVFRNQFMSDEDLKRIKYKIKTVYFIDAKIKGEDYCDRLGKISY